MTEPTEFDLIALATPYALHAMSDAEIADVERRLAAAPAAVAEAFAEEVRAVRETMAVMSAATVVEPPEHLRQRVLADVAAEPGRLQPRRRRWQTAVLAAAAVVAIGLGALGVGLALRPAAPSSTIDQVFAAPDVQTVSGPIPSGGTATVVFSRERNAGVLVMNDVAPPAPDTVYQMWLIDDDGPHPAGTMASVAPSTTALLPDIGASQVLAFTVEPPGGSEQPTTPAFAELPLT
ncbi:anti-sigma factor [Mycolicibacterium holsaticum]|uniref:anti-sigma factor n=1 Tax=Mycolicibacterium holsaticum TaxID=152142 RepID=UPI001C7D35B9|nr:anti-sigma factor [Mycolicibacterium holsaticum]MDA4109748.1 anti-sigma K factor [Mycolicibacterium holsaticum DSM 44478 = JCM 12374]QZA10669.1 anti-sigma factor [Mycolicibacterium holsaticum DSM 44478 = JCM 12374]UNC11827.1 anti-sigma factor [Mycolicibacterium holsaticum DSM 44478 = JCM 12374]